MPAGFFDPVEPARFKQPRLRFRNQRWAARVGLESLSDEEWLDHFARFEPLPNNLSAPLALRYHGHQFRAYNPALGDGRGFLFAQLHEHDRILDLGTKGSGTTPYSRGGDGRLTLKGAVRELLATEMLEALGVYTSKTFSVVETDESLQRNDEPSPTRAAVLVRLGHSHIRFGSFERHAAEDRPDRTRLLVDHCIEHYYPHLLDAAQPRRDLDFFAEVAERSADLVASWMVAGFVHGVLNTDNMNICGESFDYGPWRFLPTYNPALTAAYFDHSGLYAFGRQPEAVLWNLMRLADAIATVADPEITHALLRDAYAKWLETGVLARVLERLGLERGSAAEDAELVDAAYSVLARTQAGYDQFFFDWYGGAQSRASSDAAVAKRYSGPEFERFAALLGERSATPAAAGKLQDTTYFSGTEPVSLEIDEVERIWAAIAENDDWSQLEAKLAHIRTMGAAFGAQPGLERGDNT